jgi:uncharacterized protein YhaN
MTEKRFTYGNSDKGIALTDELKCEHYYWLSSEDCKDIVDLLNELHEEIEYLKPLANENTHYIADMEDDIITFKQKIEKLEKENEQLKARIGYLERKIQRERNSTQKQYEKWEKEAETKIKELSEENEQLKQALKNSYINEICENCKYGHYWISETFGFGKEGEFECTKKHFGNDHWKCDGLTECDEFELEIKGGVE